MTHDQTQMTMINHQMLEDKPEACHWNSICFDHGLWNFNCSIPLMMRKENEEENDIRNSSYPFCKINQLIDFKMMVKPVLNDFISLFQT